MNNLSLESSYQYCLELAKNHYENFPVASLLIPKSKRKFIAAVYAFARVADDIADEGNLKSETRIARLVKYKDLFDNRICTKEFPNLPAIYDTVEKNSLTDKNFLDLISAFIQDNQKNKYKDFEEVLGYCEKSANPVGRILLELFDIRNEIAFNYSDQICTALQLTNFYQDLSLDIEKDRFYISEDTLNQFELSYNDLISFKTSKLVNDNFKQMMKYLIDINFKLFDEGENLLGYLHGLFKKEIKLTLEGGREILNKIISSDYNPFLFHPKLNKFNWLRIILRSLI